jgi:hypothetical protein
VKTLLVSPEYFDRIRQKGEEEEEAEALEVGKRIRSLLRDKKRKVHPYENWVKL